MTEDELSPRGAIPSKWIIIPLVLVFLPLAIPLVVLYLGYGLLLHIAVWTRWIPRGKHVLFVTSDSPVWSEYIEWEILRQIEPQAVVLNWSHRSEWRGAPRLAVWIFHFFGGRREFNPMAVVFRRYRPAKVYRFWKPFRDFKHGKTWALEAMKAEFLDTVRSSMQG